MEVRFIQALLFDLDGTLLQTDFDEIMPGYLAKVSARFAQWIKPDVFKRQLLASTQAAIMNKEPNITVIQAFMDDFFPSVGLDKKYIHIFDEFYRTDFPKLGENAVVRSYAKEAVQAAFAGGYKVVIATNPVFPQTAIQARLAWTGLQDYPFCLITHGEIMHYCKPHGEYYLEIADLIGCPPEDCFMIGNDPIYDLGAKKVGMSTFLLGEEVPGADYWGTMQDVYEFIKKRGGD